MRSVMAAVAMMAGLGTAAAQGLESQYTSLQGCTEMHSLSIPGQVYEAGGATSITKCAGPAGWALYVVDQDPRSFLVVDDGERAYSLEADMLGLGDFPNVAATKKAEWWVRGKRPQSLIVRIAFIKNNAAKSTLMVFDLRKLPPRLIGTTLSNEKARNLARR